MSNTTETVCKIQFIIYSSNFVIKLPIKLDFWKTIFHIITFIAIAYWSFYALIINLLDNRKKKSNKMNLINTVHDISNLRRKKIHNGYDMKQLYFARKTFLFSLLIIVFR